MKFWNWLLIALVYAVLFGIAGIAAYYTPELYKLLSPQVPYWVPPIG
jgi:Na+/proline symporter